MKKTKQESTFGCPQCGKDSIVEINTVYAEYPVTAWEEDGTPNDYEAAEILWDTADPANEPRYRCTSCNHFFSEPKNLKDDSPESDMERDLRAGKRG